MKLNFENISLSTIPFGLLLLQETCDLGKKVFNYFSRSSCKASFEKSQIEIYDSSCKYLDENKNNDLGLSQKVQSLIRNEEVEIVFLRLGIFSQPGKGGNIQEKLNSDDFLNLFEEDIPRLDEVQEAFEVFDMNRDGYIDAEELQRVHLALGMKEGLEIENCRMMIRAFDENNDDLIDYQEFLRFMEHMDC
ncbi:calmodulin-related [Lithospermum erythrorhizon]|uniref:Calmodulin-related n=1 Tax=Lithospermum erythrorhizon TaxID=34254 RepID=A0AAV3NIA4_LITER